MDERERDQLKHDAVSAGLEAAKLDECDRSTVTFYVDRIEDDSWRECCGSNCIPCMQQVAQAVDIARGRLVKAGVTPGG
ncbi:MAG: hypothetical protein AAF533_14050 [Acidobacteriota bacterium]